MKVIILALVAGLAISAGAEPSCPPPGDTETVVYFPHPTDCNKFLTCHRGNLVELSCPSGTFWNDAVKACDLQGNVVCTPQPEPTTVEPTTGEPVTTTTDLVTTTSTTETPSTVPSRQCPEFYDPNYQVYLPHTDCSKYYICTWGGVAVEQKCPPNLHWNQNLLYCDYPAQAGCSSGNSTPQSTAEAVTSTTTAPTSAPLPPSTSTSTPASSSDCPDVYDPNHQVYFPHADCTKYYICTFEGNKLEQNCPAGLHWSQKQSYCDRPELAQCTPLK